MSALNTVALTGRVTRDPEIKYTPTGKAVASFSIACDRYTKNEAGEYDTDFFNVTAWGKTAEYLSNYIKKGRLVGLSGRLQQRSWVDKTSGDKRSVVEIVAENITALEKAKDGNGDVPAAAPAARPAPVASSAPAGTFDDEADPFADE